MTRALHCDTCVKVQPHEQPPCVDGHGRECPDWVCTGCNTAVVVAPVLLIDRRSPVIVRRSTSPGRHRRAA
jgi:hypothetical protein